MLATGSVQCTLGTQIKPRDDCDYRVWAQLGVTHVCVDPPATRTTGAWTICSAIASTWNGSA